MGTIAPMLLHIDRKFSYQPCSHIVYTLSNTRWDLQMRRKTPCQQIMLSGGWFSVLTMSQQVKQMMLTIRHGHLRISISCARKVPVGDCTQVGSLLRNDRGNLWVFLSIPLPLPLNTIPIWLRVWIHRT